MKHIGGFLASAEWIFDYLYSAPLSVPLKIAQITKVVASRRVAGPLITEGHAAKRGPIMIEH